MRSERNAGDAIPYGYPTLRVPSSMREARIFGKMAGGNFCHPPNWYDRVPGFPFTLLFRNDLPKFV